MGEHLDSLARIVLVVFMIGNLLEMGLRLTLTETRSALRDIRFTSTTLIWAFVVGRTDEAAVIEHCRGLLPGFKVPKRVIVLDELPRTASGKVERPSLESRAHDLRQRR